MRDTTTAVGDLIERRNSGRTVSILDDWPLPPKAEHRHEDPGLTDLKRWKLQTLLSASPYGIPSLALAGAYKEMFGGEFDIEDHGFEHLSDMLYKLPDIFAIQEPDDITALLFPDFPQDIILHDARLEHDFEQINSADDGLVTYKNADPDTLISYAWINRDEDFPQDVALAGEKYLDLILPMRSADVPGTRGVHQALIMSVASPDLFYIHINSADLRRIQALSEEAKQYFQESKHPIDAYSVPQEFLYPGFPCLVYDPKGHCWERCAILSRSSRNGEVIVDVVDYGDIRKVKLIQLYLMPRKYLDIPKQAIPVSLIGLKPGNHENKWHKTVGHRMRCWSEPDYLLDCLLVEAKVASIENDVEDLYIKNSDDSNNSISIQKSPKKKRPKTKAQYEVILCDRNDDELDILLDKILVMETYALYDTSRIGEIDILHKQFSEAIKDIPRPKNPLKSGVDDSSSSPIETP